MKNLSVLFLLVMLYNYATAQDYSHLSDDSVRIYNKAYLKEYQKLINDTSSFYRYKVSRTLYYCALENFERKLYKNDEEAKIALDLTFNYLAPVCKKQLSERKISERKYFSILLDSCKVIVEKDKLLYDAMHEVFINNNLEKAYSLFLQSNLIPYSDKELKFIVGLTYSQDTEMFEKIMNLLIYEQSARKDFWRNKQGTLAALKSIMRIQNEAGVALSENIYKLNI